MMNERLQLLQAASENLEYSDASKDNETKIFLERVMFYLVEMFGDGYFWPEIAFNERVELGYDNPNIPPESTVNFIKFPSKKVDSEEFMFIITTGLRYDIEATLRIVTEKSSPIQSLINSDLVVYGSDSAFDYHSVYEAVAEFCMKV